MNNTFEIINGRKYKKCKDNQIRNPKTNRCIKNPKIFNSFINDRIKYNDLLKTVLNIDENNDNYCMRLYKYGDDGKPIYRIEDNIIFKKQIGLDSDNGVIYLSNIKDFEFAIKCVVSNNANKKEIKLLKIVSDAVLNNKCPHFPILYADLKCKDFSNEIKDINNYPKIFQKNKKKSFYFLLNELASGDLKTFLENFHNDYYLLSNAFAQIYLSLIFFYQETKHFHCDAHWGNFLYHKIKPGGYFHYNIFGNDYYIENYGFLWVIWDYGNAIDFKKSIKETIYVNNDFKHIINAFFNDNNTNKKGWLSSKYLLNDNFKIKIEKINKELYIDTLKEFNFIHQNRYHPTIFTRYSRKYNIYTELPKEQYDTPDKYQNMIIYSPENMNNILLFILNILEKNNILKTNIKSNSKIINKQPYIIKYYK
jgi:hypothetical protein